MASDLQSICETVYRYALGVDTRNWALYRSIFADDVLIDFSSYNDQPAAMMRADDWVSRVTPLFTGLTATQHTMTNPITTVSSTSATCQMYMQAEHLLDSSDASEPRQRWFTIGGFYTNTLQRIGSTWLLSGVTLAVLWRRGDESVMTDALQQHALR